MIRVVLDTNILVSALITYGGNEWKVFREVVEGRVLSLTSEAIIDEFLEVIAEPRFGYSKFQISIIFLSLIDMPYMVIPTEELNVIKDDPSDNKILECAVSGNAQYIISGDKHLLALGEYQGIKIINSSDFLKSADI